MWWRDLEVSSQFGRGGLAVESGGRGVESGGD